MRKQRKRRSDEIDKSSVHDACLGSRDRACCSLLLLANAQHREGTSLKTKPQGWPNEPEFDGFFTEYEPIRSSARKVSEPMTGATIRYVTSRNQWDDRSPGIREIRARANLVNDRKAACWLKFDLIESGPRHVADDDLWYACDALSSSLERLASGLIQTCAGNVGDILEAGPILHFDRLETRRDLQGSFLGVRVAQYLLRELVERYRPVFLALCPYPLQFEHCNP